MHKTATICNYTILNILMKHFDIVNDMRLGAESTVVHENNV